MLKLTKAWIILSLLVIGGGLSAAILEQVNTTSTQTLSGKTYASPIFSGTATGTYTLAGTPTLTSPTITSPTFSGTAIGTYTLAGTPTITAPILSGSVTGTYTLAGTPTLTAPILSGSVTGTYTLAGTPTITAPTISSPVFSGTATGTYTLAGTPTLTSPIINTGTVGAGPTADLGIASKLYVDQHAASGNPIINGTMEIWQRGTTFATVTNNAFTADRWGYLKVGAGEVTINRSSSVPTVAQAGVLFNYSLEVDVTTADASLAATDRYAVLQPIEGANWRHFAQRDLALSFWYLSTKTGTQTVSVNNTGFDRAWVGEFTVLTTNTWEYKTVLVTASPSAGSWDYTTDGVGAYVIFNLAAGSNFHTTAGSWQSSAGTTSASAVNAMDSTSNYVRIVGVKLELGSVATPLAHVDAQDEYVRCQRYWQKSFQYATTPAASVGAGSGELRWTANLAGAVSLTSPFFAFPVPMRTVPTFTFYNPAAAGAEVRNLTDAADLTATAAITSYSARGLVVTATGTAGTAVGEVLGVHYIAKAEFGEP